MAGRRQGSRSRRLFVVLALGVFVAVLGARIALSSDRVTRFAEQHLEQAIGGEIHIEAGVRPILWRHPGLRLGGVSRSDSEGRVRRVRAERLDVRFDLLALWKRRSQPDRAFLELQVRGVRVELATADDVAGQPDRAASEAPETGALRRLEVLDLSLDPEPIPGAELRLERIVVDRGSEVSVRVEALLGERPLGLTARITDLTGSAIRLEQAVVSADPHEANGNLSFDWGGERPRLKASLRIDEALSLAADAWPNSPGGPGAPAGPGVPGLSSLILNRLEVDLHYHVQSLTVGSTTLHEIEGSATFVRGRTNVSLTAAGPLGSLGLEASIDGSQSPPLAEARLLVAEPARDEAAPKSSEGADETYRADIQLRGRGEQAKEVLASASGRLLVGVQDYVVGDRRVPQIGGTLLSLPARFWRPDEETRVECFVAHFEAEKGVARSTGVLAHSDALTVGGKGAIRFEDGVLDFVLRPHTNKVGVVTLPVLHLKGTLRAPAVAPAYSGLAERVVEAGLLGLIDPLLIPIPFIDLGVWGHNPCAEALAGQGAIPSRGGNVFDHIAHVLAGVVHAVRRHHGEHHPSDPS